ncbi:MAG: DUF58 domain-containing protein [Cytophagales bacterium]|nr:DUF58 domain-containing protein [Cytophagales bacterium]
MKINISDLQQYGKLPLLAKKAVEGFITGLHRSPYNGFSVEFSEHKQYNMGDSTKFIDWKLFARTEKLYQKHFEEETNLRCQMIIDTSSSMRFPVESQGKLAFSILASASLTYLLQQQRDAVGLTCFSEEIEVNTPIKSTSTHLHQLIHKLEQTFQDKTINKQSNIAQTLSVLANQLHKRSLVIIFSDMLENSQDQEEIFTALQHLKHYNHEVILFHVIDKKQEIDFDFSEKPHLFTDIETGQKVKIMPSEVKKEYQKNIQKLHQELKLKCNQYHIDFIPVNCQKNMDQILLPYLIKRQKMK